MGQGHDFAESIRNVSGLNRERAILNAFRVGNHPTWCFNWQTVRLVAGPYVLELQVTPMYLAVGDDHDWFRIPMTPITAQMIADAHDAMLPTRKLVDDIFANSQVRLPQISIATNRSASETYTHHNDMIESRRGTKPIGPITAGEKKDIILHNSLLSHPGRVAIYGWHGTTGMVVQPVYTGHGASYVDYSHGVRLIKRAAILDGSPVDLHHVAGDATLFRLIQADGPLQFLRYPALR